MYNERRIKKILDFGFSTGTVIEKRCNLFVQKGRKITIGPPFT